MTTGLRDLHHPAQAIREGCTGIISGRIGPLDVLPRAGALLPHLDLVVRLVSDAAPLSHPQTVAHTPRRITRGTDNG